MVTESPLYVPTDAAEAYDAWGATCGPNALAAALGRPVMSLREAMHPYKGYTAFAGMTRALDRLGEPYAVLRKDFRRLDVDASAWSRRLTIVQWHGSWMTPGVHPGAALSRTHWVAVDHATRLVYDVNAGPTGDGGWFGMEDWKRLAATIMVEVRGCNGDWSARSTILVGRRFSA